MIMIT
ncbi:hypothetical protein D029_4832A, partial [Vibrio parahaemolyticus 970107]